VCYRPPSSLEVNDKALFKLINQIQDKYLVVLGDFNFPGLNWREVDLLDASHSFVECINNKFLYQLVEEPTRGNNFLDLLLCSDDSIVQKVTVGEPFESSDHQVIRFELNFKKNDGSAKVQTYDYFKTDYNEVREFCESLDMNSTVKSHLHNVEEIWNKLKKDFITVRNKFIKLKKVSKTNANRQPRE